MASESSGGPFFMRTRMFAFQAEFDYSESENQPTGESIYSPTFSVDGYDWYLEYFPRGRGLQHNGSYVSLYLNLESEVEEITVESSFAVLHKNGKLIHGHYPTVDNFTKNRNSWGYAKFIRRDTMKKFYCVNDVVVFSCSIKVFDRKSSLVLEPKNISEYPGGLCEHMENLWQKGERFDVTFEVEGENISAHRLIMAARSPVFEAQLLGPMAEAKMECIKIDEMKADVFRAVLHFIYTDQLEDGSTKHNNLSVELLQELLVVADRYLLHKLTLMCEDKLRKSLSADTVIATLLLADRHSRASLKYDCLDFASRPENFSLVALTEGYVSMMHGAPSLLAELSVKVKCLFPFAKKQKTG